MATLAVERHQERQQAIIRDALAMSHRRDWLATARAMQVLAAREAMASLNAILEEQGIPPDPIAKVSILPLLDRTGAGYPLEQVTAQPLTRDQLDRLLMTVLQDTARQSVASGMAARPQVTGYVRALEGNSCARCVILAGRFYRWSKGFQRHPNCFPAGVVVSGPRSEAATRRWYEGELTILATASGENLPLTGNHPVLTRRGWVPATLLQEGDEVFRSTFAEGAAPLMVPDHHQVPTGIEDVWRAFRMRGLCRVPSSAEDFHGDGGHGEVDVVLPDRSLWLGYDATLGEHFGEHFLAGAVVAPGGLDPESAPQELDGFGLAAAYGGVGRSRLGSSLLGGLLAGAIERRSPAVAQVDPGLAQAVADSLAAGPVLLGEREGAHPGVVVGDDLLDGEPESGPRWDAPGGPFTMESRSGYARQGRDLLHRLAGQVEADRLVEVRRVDWSGHVYSLTSSEGWHSANSLIVSNCDCRHIPTNRPGGETSPREVFDGMPREEQDKRFGRDAAEAIRMGADPSQVVNARRGIETAQMFGRDVKSTTVSTGRRGAYQGPGPRLMPETIIQAAQTRDQAISMLRAYGYLV